MSDMLQLVVDNGNPQLALRDVRAVSREFVDRLICDGKYNPQIHEPLFRAELSVPTVHDKVKHIGHWSNSKIS